MKTTPIFRSGGRGRDFRFWPDLTVLGTGHPRRELGDKLTQFFPRLAGDASHPAVQPA